jgi:hypothetical protein
MTEQDFITIYRLSRWTGFSRWRSALMALSEEWRILKRRFV